MNQLFTYADPKTGYAIRQYTKGEQRSAKLYFTTENFTTDDRYFFFRKQVSQDGMNPQVGAVQDRLESGECEDGGRKRIRGASRWTEMKITGHGEGRDSLQARLR